MSAFLGPVHHWLFSKIVLMESRAFALAKHLDGAEVGTMIADYGDRLTGADLAVLVGEASIHQFLQGLITKVEIFEANLVALAGPDRREELLGVAREHGAASAREALEEKGGGVVIAGEVGAFLNNAVLEGMPCDPGAQFETVEGGTLIYAHSSCNHLENWGYTAVDPAMMCALQTGWVEGFVAALTGDSVIIETSRTIANGNDDCLTTITPKENA